MGTKIFKGGGFLIINTPDSIKSERFLGTREPSYPARGYGERFFSISKIFLELSSANGCAKTRSKVIEMEFSFANDVYFHGDFKQAAEVLEKLHF